MKNISHAFSNRSVLNDVSIDVESGKVACLLGPSGCGKTTLLRIAAGLEPLQAGEVTVGDRLLAQAGKLDTPPEDRNIGLMFQDYALFPHLDVESNIAFGVDPGMSERRQWISGALDRMSLSGYATRYPHELSGGQQQRVALLRALAPDPSILLLDEPFSGLDVTLRAQVREQTLELLRETGRTALMVTHDPEGAMFMSDTLLVMNEGRLVQSGHPVDVYRHPVNTFVANLFGDTNALRGQCVEAGRVETPFGTFAAKGVTAGTTVDVIIRAEGFRALTDGDTASNTATVQVTTAYPIGRSSHLRLVLEKGHGAPLHARFPGVFIPAPGSELQIAVDPDQVFIFPTNA
ncbi:MAG: ABC transporter ATP-binding protein [Rhodospirillales bacterium]|nr:ABC transporter ATP-binding protein [Rhodospirillales bacterium]